MTQRTHSEVNLALSDITVRVSHVVYLPGILADYDGMTVPEEFQIVLDDVIDGMEPWDYRKVEKTFGRPLPGYCKENNIGSAEFTANLIDWILDEGIGYLALLRTPVMLNTYSWSNTYSCWVIYDTPDQLVELAQQFSDEMRQMEEAKAEAAKAKSQNNAN
jgi:hypothetical protein